MIFSFDEEGLSLFLEKVFCGAASMVSRGCHRSYGFDSDRGIASSDGVNQQQEVELQSG